MTPSRERRLIDDVWVYVTADEGGSGSLPSGGSTGEVLTKASNADGDADWEPGGGSQTVKCVDLGVVDAADVAAGATPVLYTPGAGEFVRDVFFTDVTFCDASGIAIGRATIFPETNGTPTRAPLGSWDSDLIHDGVATADSFSASVPLQTEPVIAGGTTNGDNPPATLWEAGATHVNGDVLFANGTYWTTSDNGDSGGSEPDFAGNAGGSVADGDVTWGDSTNTPPTVGSAHVYAIVLTPAAP